MLALVPELLGDIPGAVTYVDVPSRELSAEVEFYVPVYMGDLDYFEVMRHMPRLRVCQLLTAGYEHALECLPSWTTMCNAAGVHDASTSELAVGLILASLRGIDDFARAMPEGRWLHAPRTSLADSRVVVIGAGGLGSAVARRLEPFEVQVTLVGSKARTGVRGVGELDALLPEADIVVLAVPLTSATRAMLDDRTLGLLRDGALVVNVARGPVIDSDAILAHAGRLRFALDVTDPEPLPADHPLWGAPGVLISPHVGGNSSAFPPRARALVQAQISRLLAGEPLANIVHPAAQQD